MTLRLRWIGTLFAVGIVALAVWAALRSVPYRMQAQASLVSGEAARQFESHYDKVFPAKTFGTNAWAAIQYTLFGEGRNGVVIGEDGWLYTAEEFRDYADSAQQIDAHLALIERADAQLEARGTELVIALVPAKARLYPEHLGPHRPAQVQQALYRHLRQQFAQRDIEAPDLFDALARCKAERAVFLRTDTHWTPEGAACAAQALSAAIGPERSQPFVSSTEEARLHRGDLVQFLPLAPYFSQLLPEPDRLVPRSTHGTDASSLLGDAPAPQTVLIGTSYSADTNWNFDGALRDALDADVLNLAEPGRGPFAPMLAFLEQPHADWPKRVVWEIPERYLPRADDPVSPSPIGASSS